ncbi:MAG: CGNR zinc finger domain-containing protein [Candidatus Acidiferrales bacterium]
MSMARREHNSLWKNDFLFLGNQLALDFLNTHLVQNSESLELLSDFRAVLRWFRAANLLRSGEAKILQRQWGKSARARRTAEAMRELREKLRRETLAWERGRAIRRSTVDELNGLMEQHPMRNMLKASGGRSSTELYFEPRQPEDLFAPLAHSAAELFASVDRNRVRKCEHCVAHFYDSSKKGNRRWCSMQLCGNRAKVAAYATRQRLRRSRITKRS